MNMPQDADVALVHDWLTGMRGGEKVLEVLCDIFPRAPIFTLVHNKGSVSPLIESHRIHTSFLQRFPFKSTRYRSFLPFFPRAIESFDFTGFRLMVSTSHAVAKGAIPPKDGLHVCYCHTPMRYVWDMYEEYFAPERAGPVTRGIMRVIAPKLRSWDVRTHHRVHAFVANSHHVAERIRRIYGRPSEVLHAPVDVSAFDVGTDHDGSYLVVSALVPYKRIDLAIKSCASLGRELVIVGTGPEERTLRRHAGTSGIRFVGWCTDKELAGYYRRCRALLFPGVEDFGIVPLEAMASGKPVIAFAQGGALETVVDGTTGLLFRGQTVDDLTRAILAFEQMSFDAAAIRAHAEQFDRSRFRQKLRSLLTRIVDSPVPRLP